MILSSHEKRIVFYLSFWAKFKVYPCKKSLMYAIGNIYLGVMVILFCEAKISIIYPIRNRQTL